MVYVCSEMITAIDCNSLRPHGLIQLHGVLRARILEWGAFPFSRGSSQPTHRTQVSHIAGGFFTNWATREAPLKRKEKVSPLAKNSQNGRTWRLSHLMRQSEPWSPCCGVPGAYLSYHWKFVLFDHFPPVPPPVTWPFLLDLYFVEHLGFSSPWC